MSKHCSVARLPNGRWAVCGRRGEVLADYPTEHAAQRAIADDKTPAERARAFGNYDRQGAQTAYEAELLHRLETGLPLSRSDAKAARQIRRRQNDIGG